MPAAKEQLLDSAVLMAHEDHLGNVPFSVEGRTHFMYASHVACVMVRPYVMVLLVGLHFTQTVVMDGRTDSQQGEKWRATHLCSPLIIQSCFQE